MTHLSSFHITSISHLTSPFCSLPMTNLFRPRLFHSVLVKTYQGVFFSSRAMGQERVVR